MTAQNIDSDAHNAGQNLNSTVDWKLSNRDVLSNALQLPLYSAQPAGRANGLRDYYAASDDMVVFRKSLA